MAKFSQDFISWCNDPDKGFIINDLWDVDKNVDGGTGRLELLYPWDVILEYALKQDERGKFPCTTVVLSAPKKSAKTAMSAAIVAWYAECAPDGTEIFICANSEEQSVRLIFKDLSFHFKHRGGSKILKDKIELENGTIIQVLTRNYTSNAGGRHALVVFDELWGGTSEDDYRRYDEMTPVPMIPHSLQLITSYAGFLGESNLLYDIFKKSVGMEDPDQDEPNGAVLVPELAPLPCYRTGNAYFAYWDHEPRMPWQLGDYGDKYYKDQRDRQRDSAFIRQHENRWVTSNEMFFPIEWWDYAIESFADYLGIESKDVRSADLWKTHPFISHPVYVAVDTGMKHDCTAIIGVTADAKVGKVIPLFHKIWTPIEGETLDLEETIEPYLIKKHKDFNVVDITCDPSQMLQVMTKLSNMGLPISEFTQSDVGMIAASQALFDVLHDKNLWTYPADDLREHLQNAVAQHTSRGFRIVKDKSNRRTIKKKVDGAVALAMAVYKATLNMDFDAGEVIRIESPFAEWAESYTDPEEMKLPWALRS